jgi:lysophospholipase L1-like esterase
VPAYAPNRYGIDGAVIDQEIIPLVRQVAAQSGASVIDLHSALNGEALFHDRVHPNDAGTQLVAATIYRALTGNKSPAKSLPAATNATATVKTLAADTAPAAAGTAIAPAIVTPPAKENFHIYVLMGQSNMVGRDTSGLASQVDNPRVLSLNGDGQWVVARDPIHPQVGRIPGGVGPGISFALEMLKANPNVTIGLVPCAVGGTSLNHWVKGADLYEKAVARANIAAQAGTIKGVLWHQGESDSDSQTYAGRYETRLTRMFKDLRADLDSPNLPIVIGQLGEFVSPEKHPYVGTVRAAIDHIPTVVPNVGEASSAGLGDKGDKLHFSAEAQRVMGVRFAQAMQQLLAKNPQTTAPR